MRLFYIILILFFLGEHCIAQSIPENTGIPAHPWADGAGKWASGGRAGDAYLVTNTNTVGAGSIADAATQSNKVIIVTVAGTLQQQGVIQPQGDSLTWLFVTAPGEGFSMRQTVMEFRAANQIVLGLRMRVGADPGNPNPTQRDALSLNSSTNEVYNVNIAYSSFAYSMDEMIDIRNGAHDITIQNCIIAYPLYDSWHPSTPHSMAFNSTTGTDPNYNISVYKNLFALYNRRGTKTDSTGFEAVNNFHYGWRQHAFENQEHGFAKVINNYLQSTSSQVGAASTFLVSSATSSLKFYVAGNISPQITSADQWSGANGSKTYRVYDPETRHIRGTILNAEAVKDLVMTSAGAFPLDSLDMAVLDTIRTGEGALIDTTSETVGFETYVGTAGTDSDSDGIPDAWEIRLGTDPQTADAMAHTKHGWYVNAEVWAFYLIAEHTEDFQSAPARNSRYRGNGKYKRARKPYWPKL
jgi:hypothetical protein